MCFLIGSELFRLLGIPVIREEIASTSKNKPVSQQLLILILGETSKSFSKFKATRRSLLIKFNSPGEEEGPANYLKECITALTNYIVDEMSGRDLVGMRIRNTDNVEEKVVDITLNLMWSAAYSRK